ncbi:MAG: hypothetical protein IE934_09620 [Sphingopyxis sp.]|nr:hypothetical protein [Sphingopyxis sp.]
MPQPLDRVHPAPTISVTPSALSNSAYAGHVAFVIATWAHIDGDVGSLLARMLKADIATGTAMYLALIGGEARKAALAAAAKEALPPWQQHLLSAVIKATKPSRDQRNSFAHHAWGTADELPGTLLLMHPRVVVESNVSRRQAHIIENTRIIRPIDLDRSRIMVFREKDFADAQRMALQATRLWNLLYMVIGDTVEVARRLLLSDGAVRSALKPLLRDVDDLTREILRRPNEDEPPPRGLYPIWDAEYWDKVDCGETDAANKSAMQLRGKADQ